jgi:hypothetical protein
MPFRAPALKAGAIPDYATAALKNVPLTGYEPMTSTFPDLSLDHRHYASSLKNMSVAL